MRRFAVLPLLFLAWCAPALAADVKGATAARPTSRPATAEAAVVEVDSGVPGPTVLVIAPATQPTDGPAVAARQIRSWSVGRGRVVTAATGGPVDAAAAGRLLARYTPDWLIVLEEDESEGAAGIVAHSSAGGEPATRCLERLNAELARLAGPQNAADPPADDEIPASRPLVVAAARRSAAALAEAEQRGIPALAVEAAAYRAPASARARLMRSAVHGVLDQLSMSPSNADRLLPRVTGTINVAVYDGAGSDRSPGPAAMARALAAAEGVAFTLFGPAELHPETLRQFDVLIFPGGSGSGQAKGIGEAGAAAVRRFIDGGGGYVSSCAGTYLATNGYPWSLKILDANTVDRKHWRRGTGTVTIELTEAGRKLLGDVEGLVPIRYANGPILEPAGSGELADFTPLAYYRSEVAMNGAPRGVMIGTPAIVSGQYGAGRVICFSPHPEYTKGLEGFVRRAVSWAAGEE